jgi:hypothetical protein
VRCHIEKPLEDYALWKNSKRSKKCRPCLAKCCKEWRRLNPDKSRAISARSYEKQKARLKIDIDCQRRKRDAQNRLNRKLRESAFKILGEFCACCGEWRKEFLQIDHIKNDGAKHKRLLGSARPNGRPYGGDLYKEIVSGRTHGLQTLCGSCNWGKHINHGICPHEEERVASALLIA